MSKLFRSLTFRLRRAAKRGSSDHDAAASGGYQQGFSTPRMDPKRSVQCKIILLDGTDMNITISKNSSGQEVYDQVFYSLDLEEKDYFGLQFTDHYHVQHWLDPSKKVTKQVPIGPPYTFRFRVKFYTMEPTNLREELTRYQFFLQLKQDIHTGRLECPRETAIELAAYALQSELGDFNPVEHNPILVSEFRFHPQQDEEMELAILEKFKTCKGQSPATAELNYLNKAKLLDLYGVDLHEFEGKDGNTYKLGLTPAGALIFDGNQKIGLFLWEKIQRLDFKNKKLTLVVEDTDQEESGQVQLHTFVFSLTSHKACKHLWKCAIEHHAFFRLKFHPQREKKTRELFRLGSTFRYRGRTEYENIHKDGGRLSRRQTSTFERKPSQRFSARQSYLNKRWQQREEVKQQVAASMGLTSLSTHQPAVSTISTGPQCGIELSAPLNSTSKPTNNDLQDKVIINDSPSVPPAFYSLGSLERTTAASPVSRTYAEPSSSFCRTQSPSLSEKRSIIQQLDGSPTSLLRNSSSPQYDESMSNGDARKNIQRIVVQMNGFEENDGDPSTSSLNGINIPPGAKGSGLEKPVESSSQSSSYSSTSYSQHSSLPQASSYLLQPSRLTQRNYLTTGSSDTAAQVKILTPPDSPDIVKPQVDSASSASIQAVVESSPCISESLDTTPVLTASVSISPKPPRHASEIPVLKCDHYDSVRNITKTEFSTDHLQPQLSVNVSTTKIRPPSASSLQHPAKSQSQKPSSSHIPVSTLPEKSGDQQPISPVSDSSRSRSRLPVPSTSSDAAKCATHERVSHSRIPKMTSGHRPPHFNPHTQVERCQAGITTSIPTFRNGFPPTHSQVTTDI